MAAPKKEKVLPQWTNFLTGGLGGMTGWLFVHPFDVAKTRMQLAETGAKKVNTLQLFRGIVEKEGPAGLYSGLSAALLRQATYTTMRQGLYQTFRDMMPLDKDGRLSFLKLALAGVAAGSTAAFLSCPIEVCLIRMQADGRLPLDQRRGYKNVFDALIRISKEEGVLTYWRGATPTVGRAAVVSVTQLATYDLAKRNYKNYLGLKEGLLLHFSSSLTSGFIYSACSLPLDIAKTRMQSQKPLADGSMLYKNTIQTVLAIVRSEGPLSLWNGFLPYFLRSGGHTITMFLFLEQYKKLVNKFYD